MFTEKKNRFYAQDSSVATNSQFTDYECQSQYYCLKERAKRKIGQNYGSFLSYISGPDTAGPNHPPMGLLRLNLRIFYISFHFSTKLSR